MVDALHTLIARVEAATGPDRRLDAEIAASVRSGLPAGCDWAFKFPKWEGAPNNTGTVRIIGNQNGNCDYISGNFQSPIYTGSLDAATNLIPPGFEWALEIQAGHLPGDDLEQMIAIAKLGDPIFNWEATAATPALAIVAAALKATATHSTGEA